MVTGGDREVPHPRDGRGVTGGTSPGGRWGGGRLAPPGDCLGIPYPGDNWGQLRPAGTTGGWPRGSRTPRADWRIFSGDGPEEMIGGNLTRGMTGGYDGEMIGVYFTRGTTR